MKVKQYSFPKDSLSQVQNSQLKSFDEEFISIGGSGNISINFSPKGYKINDLHSPVFDSKVQAIGLFSGAGGLDVGTQLAGVKVISSLDFDHDSVATMQLNKYFSHTEHLHRDIRDITGQDYKNIITRNNPEKLILVGGPPCQPFSKAGYWVTHENRLGSEDPRNMIGQYLELISELQPDGFVLENVESILHPKNINVVNELEERIDKLGYDFIAYKANALDFGVPQKRKRIFFIATKKTITSLPLKTHGSEKEIVLNTSLQPYERVIDWIGVFDLDRYFEREELTTGKTYDAELKQIPPGKNYFALTERDGHLSPKFQANKRFWNFLLKLHPTLPSWTIAAQPGPWVGPFHWNNRRLRVPEIAALQTFPSDYKFMGSRRSVQKQIGNAVPPLLGNAIVKSLISNIQ